MEETGGTTPVEEVNYSDLAQQQVQSTIQNVDFSVFFTMLTLVIGATIGVTVGITALRKGVRWVIGFIKGL